MFRLKKGQSVPQCFIEKMDVDQALSKLRAFSIVDYEGYKKLKQLQQSARRLCQINVERKPAGSAGAQ